MKITLFQRLMGFLIIKPLLRKNESIETLTAMAEGLSVNEMTYETRIIQHFAKEVLKEIQ